jgi:hypothetical protein
VVLRDVGDERDRAILEDTYCAQRGEGDNLVNWPHCDKESARREVKRRRTVFDVAPLLEMPSHDLFRLGPRTGFLDAPDVERAVLSSESADAAHVIAIVGKLVAREAVLARIGQRAFRIRERMQVLALPAVGTTSAGKEETAVAYAGRVCARQAGVFLDVAPRLGFRLAAEIQHHKREGKRHGQKNTYLE